MLSYFEVITSNIAIYFGMILNCISIALIYRLKAKSKTNYLKYLVIENGTRFITKYVLLGKGLDSSINCLISELKTKKSISIITLSNLIGAVIRRLLWSGIALALIAILPALFSFYILLRQNDLIDAQNKIQNRQLRVQELSIESQKNIDYERQMDKIFLNLPDSIKLEQVNQIVSFSKFIQPSRFDLNTNLDLKNPISKIKANLLLKIVEDKRLENIISDILIKADFSNSDLRYQFIEDKNFNYIKANNSDFSETILKNVNIKGSNLKGTFFQSCRLELCHFNGSKIADADLKNCTFSQCFLRNVDFSGTDLRDTKFFNCIFINEADIVSNKFNLNMAKVSSTKFFANIWNEHNIGVDQIERFFYIDPSRYKDSCGNYYLIKKCP